MSFNFIKMMLICEDEVAAKEIYAAESLSRYISSMLYCLVISDFILLIMILIDFISSEKLLWPLVGILILLIIVIWCYNKRCYREYCRIYHPKKNDVQPVQPNIEDLKKLRNTSVFYLSAFILILSELIFTIWFDLKKESYLIELAFIIYLFGIFAILHNFRIIRHKEVDIVFALALKNQNRLFSSKGNT